MADSLVIFAQRFPEIIDRGQADEETALRVLAEEARWNPGRLHEAAEELQRDPDALARSIALLIRAAERAAGGTPPPPRPAARWP